MQFNLIIPLARPTTTDQRTAMLFSNWHPAHRWHGTAPIFQMPLLLICCALHHRRHCVGFVQCLKNDFPLVVLVLVLLVRNRNRAGSWLGSLELAGETWETPQQSSFIFLPSNRLPALPHFFHVVPLNIHVWKTSQKSLILIFHISYQPHLLYSFCLFSKSERKNICGQ